MTFDLMEVYSLEEGDQIYINGSIYKVLDIEDGDVLDYRLNVADEEGYRRHIEAESTKKFRLVLDNLELID